jgi:hypothetical protein
MTDTDETQAPEETAENAVNEIVQRHQAPEAPTTAEQEKDITAAALNELAKAEDVSAYAREVQDQKAIEETLDPERHKRAVERHREIVRKATEEAAKGRGELEDGPATEQTSEPEPDQSDFEAALQRERVRGMALERFNTFERANPEKASVIGSTFTVIEPGQHLKDRIMESPVGPEVAFRIANAPDAIEMLNTLSPEQLHTVLSRVEGAIEAERHYETQQRGIPPKRVSSAPPPMKTPRGGASEPQSLEQLAKSEDATAYINETRRRERAREKARQEERGGRWR